MALWQFTLDLIPISAARVNGINEIHMSREQLGEIELGITVEQMPDLFKKLGELLPEKKAWSRDLRIWGDEKSHDVQIWFEGARIEAFQLRLDVANPSSLLVKGMCRLACDLECIFATRDGKIIQPSVEEIVKAMMRSSATRFVRDPQGYIKAAIQAGKD